jgi:lipopolysaccharide biosynthesis glycosyltransferase
MITDIENLFNVVINETLLNINKKKVCNIDIIRKNKCDEKAILRYITKISKLCSNLTFNFNFVPRQSLTYAFKKSYKRVMYCTVCTGNYFEGLVKLLKSLIANFNDFDSDFFVFYNTKCDPLVEKHFEQIKKIYAKVQFIGIDGDKFNITRKTKPKRLTKNCFLSFYAFKNYGYDKNIFLDSDMIVRKDFRFLLSSESSFIGSIDNSHKKYRKEFSITKITGEKDNPNINSGFMIIDSKYLGDDTFNNLVDIANNTSRMINGDQCAINLWLKDKDRIILPFLFNYQIKFAIKNGSSKSPSSKLAFIYHYIGSQKPWMYNPQNKFDREWHLY